MITDWQTELKRILAKEPQELSDNDIAFMKSRMVYIGKVSRAKFADILNPQPEKTKKKKEKPVVSQQPTTQVNPESEKKNDISIHPADLSGDLDEDEDEILPNGTQTQYTDADNDE